MKGFTAHEPGIYESLLPIMTDQLPPSITRSEMTTAAPARHPLENFETLARINTANLLEAAAQTGSDDSDLRDLLIDE